MSIHRDNLPQPSSLDISRAPVTYATTREGVLRFRRRPDPVIVPQTMRAVWQDVRREVARAISDHFRLHFDATFLLRDPRTAAEVHVRYRSAPTFTWSNPVTATVSAELESVFAY